MRGGPYDLIIMANCLNELFPASVDPPAERAAVVSQLLPFLAPHGTIMIVEPALRQTARALHHVRNHLLKKDLCTVYSPCLHEGACPALDRPDDWCHEERPWQTPPAIAAIDRDVGFIKDALKFSYLLLRTDGRTIVTRSPQTFRVVSELRELKGEKRAWLCNETGRPEVGRLDRKASPHNAAVDSWHRGAIVQIERIVRKERDGKVSLLGRIESDAAVGDRPSRLNISGFKTEKACALSLQRLPGAPSPRRSEVANLLEFLQPRSFDRSASVSSSFPSSDAGWGPLRSGASRSMPHASLRVWKRDRSHIHRSRFSDGSLRHSCSVPKKRIGFVATGN